MSLALRLRTALAPALLAFTISRAGSAQPRPEGDAPTPKYEAGSSTFCVVDGKRGFDRAGGVLGGKRVLVVETWYPIDRAVAEREPLSKFGDYFGGDRELLQRTERALLTRSGVAESELGAQLELAEQQFDLLRNSHRNARLARGEKPFPLVIYSHGTLQQRFSNDALAEELARHGYIVVAPEHTGNAALTALKMFCPAQLRRRGVAPSSLANNANYDVEHGEYAGQRLEPFFLEGAAGEQAALNPAEVALTLDRVADYRAVIAAARRHFRGRVLVRPRSVGLVGYSRGAMHGLVGAELIPEIGASALLLGGTPLAFYARDPAAAPINAALAKASHGKRRVLDHLTKPVLEIIGGEDTRRKATSEVAAALGMYPAPSAANPSPLVAHSLAQLDGGVFGALVQVDRLEHGDLVDDPFVIGYRAPAAQKRAGAFDASLAYVSRSVNERQAIRDHFVLWLLDHFSGATSARARNAAAAGEELPNPFAAAGVHVKLRFPSTTGALRSARAARY